MLPSFLHPGILLFGVCAASIPIIIHLLFRQQPRPIEFPALQLLRKLKTRTVRRLRLRHLILMALRMALLLLLALALARPTLHSELFSIDEEAPVAAFLIFDTSLSMQFEHHGKTRLELAVELATQVVRELPEKSEVTIIETGDPAANVPLDVLAAKSFLEKLELRTAPRIIDASLEVAYKGLKETQLSRREAYLFTDLAAGAWNLGDDHRLDRLAKEVGPGLRVYIIDVGVEDPENLALGELQPKSNPFSERGELEVTIRNSGTTVDRTIELWVDGQIRDNKAVHLPANESIQVTFAIPLLAKGLHQGQIHLASGDPMTFDDDRYFTLEVHPPIRVLVVADRVEDTLFWTRALEPNRFRLDRKRQDRKTRYEIDSIGSEELLRTNIDSYRVISLLNVGSLPDSAWLELSHFVRQGGGLFVALGERVDPGSYASKAAQTVLAGRPTEEVRAPQGEYLAPENFAHPLLTRFREWKKSDFPIRPVLHYWKVEPAEEAIEVIPLTDGNPGLIERSFGRFGSGRSLLFVTAAHYQEGPDPWTELPLGWSYLVLAHETVRYLAGYSEKQKNFLAGTPVILPLEPSDPFVRFSVTDPDGHIERFTVDPLDPSMSVPSAELLGNYRVDAAEAGRTFRTGFSVNEPASESNLTKIEADRLKKFLGPDRLSITSDLEDLERVIDEGRVGKELFPWLMILVVALICAEGYLANRFYRKATVESK